MFIGAVYEPNKQKISQCYDAVATQMFTEKKANGVSFLEDCDSNWTTCEHLQNLQPLIKIPPQVVVNRVGMLDLAPRLRCMETIPQIGIVHSGTVMVVCAPPECLKKEDYDFRAHLNGSPTSLSKHPSYVLTPGMGIYIPGGFQCAWIGVDTRSEQELRIAIRKREEVQFMPTVAYVTYPLLNFDGLQKEAELFTEWAEHTHKFTAKAVSKGRAWHVELQKFRVQVNDVNA